jgi:hypothetical protein
MTDNLIMVIVCKCNVHLRFQYCGTAFADGAFLIECGKAVNKHCHIQFLTFQDVHVQKCQCRKLGIQYGGELLHILSFIDNRRPDDDLPF